MLVLARKKGESILIGESIEISILDVANDIIKIGITAPREIGILRKELYLSVEDMNKNAEKSIISSNELKKQYKHIKKSE
jgi:carbon storage regulator